MNILDRIRSMIGVGAASENLSDAVRRREIGQQDQSRHDRHGDLDTTTLNATAFAHELDSRAKKIG